MRARLLRLFWSPYLRYTEPCSSDNLTRSPRLVPVPSPASSVPFVYSRPSPISGTQTTSGSQTTEPSPHGSSTLPCTYTLNASWFIPDSRPSPISQMHRLQFIRWPHAHNAVWHQNLRALFLGFGSCNLWSYMLNAFKSTAKVNFH